MTYRAALAAALMCAACGDDGNKTGDAAPGPDADPNGYMQVAQETPAPKLDLLFVMDDTISDEDQINFAAALPTFVNALDTVPDGTSSLHAAVVTSDMGTTSVNDAPAPNIGQAGQQGACIGAGKNGAFQHGMATSDDFSDAYIDTTDGGNFTGGLSDTLAKMVRVGVNGCGFEQPLSAMKHALDGTNPGNTGFLRDDALLAVVFLTDEDDCSASHGQTLFSADTSVVGPLQSFRCTRFGVTCTGGGATPDEMNTVGNKTGCSGSTDDTYVEPTAPYVTFLKSLKADPSRILVSVVAGQASPVAVELRAPSAGQDAIPALAHSCEFSGSDGIVVADPAVRLQEFASAFTDANTFSTVCQTDLSGAQMLDGGLVAATFGTGCLANGTPDADPNTVGLQLDCIVTDSVNGTDTDVPQCTVGTQPLCWETTQDAVCTSSPHLRLVVHRQVAADPATITRMKCRA